MSHSVRIRNLLTNGHWYEVERNFCNTINERYEQLINGGSSLYLPNYEHDNESEYNKKVAENDTDFFCMDKNIIWHGGGYGQIEFCDLLRCKQIIHVKRYGASSVLSHLISQGFVSAELFITDAEFRSKVNEKLPDKHKFSNVAERPNASDYEVVFAVISSSENQLRIPFFSRVNLNSAEKRLKGYGYSVSLVKIATNEAEPD